jgi:diguanylate cyclase (GGDEF)-like protein
VAKQIFTKIKIDEYNLNLQNLLSIQEEKIKTLDMLIKESNRIDNLTGLGNSIYLFERIHQIYNSNQNYSAMIFDINKFNSINNAYGMQYGDSLLRKVAKILRHIFEDDRFDLFRLESDKFVLLVRDPEGGDEMEIAEQIEQTFLDNTFLLKNDIVITVRLTIGILRHIEREQDIVSKLIRVLSELKFDKHKKKFYLFYDPESQFVKRQEENIVWMDRIRRVIEKRDVYPVFQPIVENRTGNIKKFESLMRIKYSGEFITPFHFLEPATVLGLLPQLTRIIIEKTFQKFEGTQYQFSINISEDDIAENYLLQFIPEMLEKYDVKPSQVILEILENMTTQEQLVLDHLEVLKDIGVQIAIDDFGSENSNFGRLSNIKANIIKIDGSFIKNMDLNLENRKIVKSIIFLAKELGAETVAEFVHNEAIHQLTKELGIDYAQGFYLGAPKMDITNIEGE